MNIVAQYISTFTFPTNNTGILYELLRWEWYFAATSGRAFKPASWCGRLRLKCDCTRAETRFRRSAKRTSPFKSAGASVQSTIGSRVARISSSNAAYTMFRGSVKGTGYPLYSPVYPLHPPPVCQRVPSHFNWTLIYLCTVISFTNNRKYTGRCQHHLHLFLKNQHFTHNLQVRISCDSQKNESYVHKPRT
jgi:hypothetical protein